VIYALPMAFQALVAVAQFQQAHPVLFFFLSLFGR
jgi:hypothetical protein